MKTFRPVGKGRQGIIFFGEDNRGGNFALKVSPRDLWAEKQKHKQPAEIEFAIQNAVFDVAADSVVRPYDFLKCKNFIPAQKIDMQNVQDPKLFDRTEQSIIRMEWCENGTFKNYYKTNMIQDDVLYFNLVMILRGLLKIRAEYPDFRHNDLHLDNVFVMKDGHFKIGDFGWARLKKTGTNPAVNFANGTSVARDFGIGPRTDPRYDHHLLLNEIREMIKKTPDKFPKTLDLVDRAVPPGYRGQKDKHVNEWRLKYGDPCPGLPDIPELLKEPGMYPKYVKLITSANLKAARLKLRKRSANLTPPDKKKSKLTNAQLINMSAVEFAQLSPKTRARATLLRAAKKKAGGVKLLVAKGPSPKKIQGVVPKKANRAIPKNVLKDPKLDKLIEKEWKSQGGPANESFQDAWNRARTKVLNRIRNRLAKNLPAFTTKLVSSANLVGARARLLSYKPSPTSGRIKIKGPTGRYVYADGTTITLEYLQKLARARRIKNIGTKTKKELVQSLFTVKKASPPKVVPKLNYKRSPTSGRIKIKAPKTGQYVYANGSTIPLEYLKQLALSSGLKNVKTRKQIIQKLFPA